jgi:murein L,D-transpeptidase YcbB/YkuD
LATPDPLLWFDQSRPTPAAERALGVLAGASADGLEAADYLVEELRLAMASSARLAVPDEERMGRLDHAMSSAVRRYLMDLRGGRVDPRQFGIRYSRPADADTATSDRRVEELAAAGSLDEAASRYAPDSLRYTDLRQALQHYRGLIGNDAFRQAA